MTTPKPKTIPIPDHGIGIRTVVWDRLFEYLDSCVVMIPEYAPGEPPDPSSLANLMARVQNNRQKVESLYRIVQQRIAEAKRAHDTAKEGLRVERSQLIGQVAGYNAEERKANLEAFTIRGSATVNTLAAIRAAFEGAEKAVRSQLDTLETAKQTLNSIRQLVTEPLSGDGFGLRNARHGRGGFP